jgi:large subunit ribosomal protein L4
MESIVYNQKGDKAGSIKLPESIFNVQWNSDAVHQVVTSDLSSRRGSIAHAKTRGEVSGGGKKPWRQKGTGRARHGSTRSPIWVGGGTTHGPRNDKNYDRKINKSMINKALAMVLSKKVKENEIVLIDDIKLSEVKTKNAVSIIKAIAKIENFKTLATKKNNVAYIALPKIDDSVKRSFANLSNMQVLETRNLNATDLLSKKFLILVSPEASIKVLSERLNK